MTRIIAFMFCLLLPAVAFADEPSTVTVTISDLGHAINYLQFGGSHAEGVDLAAKLSAQAQADITRQHHAPPPAPPESAK